MPSVSIALRRRNEGRPVGDIGPRIAIHDERFAEDPHGVYEHMRASYGAVVPVWIADEVEATLVIGYHAAVAVLNDPAKFPADPRGWQRNVPAGCPIRPMLEYRPNALRSTGVEHAHYRDAINAALAGFDVNALRDQVRRLAATQIGTFCARGHADLLADYAHPLVSAVLTSLLGCSTDLGHRISDAIARMFEGADTADVNDTLSAALYELVTSKRGARGGDLTSRMLDHGQLSVEEICHQLVTLYSAGIEPVANLIVNTTDKILTDPRYTSSIERGGLGIGEAINEILVTDPPLAAHCVTYPRQPTQIEGVWVPANQPVVISMAACNRDPAVIRLDHGDFSGNGYAGGPAGSWNLAFGSGPHSCPATARDLGYYITSDAITELLDLLPDLAPAGTDRAWRPGPFHRALSNFPVTFPPTDPSGIPLPHPSL